MISQVSLLYPVKFLVGPKQEQELELFSDSSRSGDLLVDIINKHPNDRCDRKE